jgi:hypothetical protein
VAYQEQQVFSTLELNLPKKRHWAEEQSLISPRTPSEWFADKFSEQVKQYGCPFLEMRESTCDGFTRITPISINVDFFAASLGGDSKLGHSVVYFEPEMQWYFKDLDSIYKPTSAEKLQNLYRAMLIRCAQELNSETHKLNLFHEFRSDKTAKAVVNRAKSILAADHAFFSATSKHQRVRGPELHERLVLALVETMLEPREGAILTVTQAYQMFCDMGRQRNLNTLKRSIFKEMMRDLIRNKYGMALRNDVPDSENRQQQAWRGLAVVNDEALAA